jgi:hypothetical protein
LDSIGPLSAQVKNAASDLRTGLLARRGARKTPPSYASVADALAARVGSFGITAEQALGIVERGTVAGAPASTPWRWRTDPRLTQPSPTRFSEAQVVAAISAIQAPTMIVLAQPRAQFLDGEIFEARLSAYRATRLLQVLGNHHFHVLADCADTPDWLSAVGEFLAEV